MYVGIIRRHVPTTYRGWYACGTLIVKYQSAGNVLHRMYAYMYVHMKTDTYVCTYVHALAHTYTVRTYVQYVLYVVQVYPGEY